MSNIEHDAGLKLRMRGEERRISSQHRQLEELFDRVMESVRVGGTHKAVNDFLLFSTALEAHMSVEEDIYFPALHGLRNDVGDELGDLVDEHQRLREKLADLRLSLAKEDEKEGRAALGELANDVDRHEHTEEKLIARITEGPVSGLGHTSLDT
jgi:iron-sulfur cluster repair protein YtfE (RIC family)